MATAEKEMPQSHPPIEPYERGMLDVGDGQRVYWETCGNPVGKPALVLHGGPGSGCTPGWTGYFDPERGSATACPPPSVPAA